MALPFDQQNINVAVQQLANATPGLLKIPTTSEYDPAHGTSVQNFATYSIRALRSSKGTKYSSSFSEQTIQSADEIWTVAGNLPLEPKPGSIIDISPDPSVRSDRFLTVDPAGLDLYTDFNGETWVRLVDGSPNAVLKDFSGNVLPPSTLKKGYFVKLGLVLPGNIPSDTPVIFEKIYVPGSEPYWQMVQPNQPPISNPPGSIWSVIDMYRGPGLQDPAYYLLAVKG